MKTYALKRTETPWEEDAIWETLYQTKVPNTSSDHLADWKWAVTLFRSIAPDIMKDFGNGCLAVVLVESSGDRGYCPTCGRALKLDFCGE